jgi:hypothetical protein
MLCKTPYQAFCWQGYFIVRPCPAVNQELNNETGINPTALLWRNLLRLMDSTLGSLPCNNAWYSSVT